MSLGGFHYSSPDTEIIRYGFQISYFAAVLLSLKLCSLLVKAPSEDLHFPCITAGEDNVLEKLLANFLDGRCKVALQRAEKKVLLMDAKYL